MEPGRHRESPEEALVHHTCDRRGQHGQLQQDNQGYAYRNIDGTSTNNQRYVYVLINPTSAAGPTTWDISVTVESTVGE